MATVVEERQKVQNAVSVLPFGVEADHPRNSDLLLQCIPGARLRSAIDGTKHTIDSKTGDIRIPLDQSRHLGSFPRVPGMQIHVNPGALTYVILDPLHDNVEMCDRIRKYLKENSSVSVSERLNGVSPQSGVLDTHRMKSLVRELVWLVDSGEAKRVKGTIPEMKDIDELPGYFLLNPGSRVGTTQPIYEKDWESWVAALSHSGG